MLDPPAPRHERWPWRDYGGFQMTEQRALGESVYAVLLAQAVMSGKADEFMRSVKAVLLPTSAPYRRREGDWAEGSRQF